MPWLYGATMTLFQTKKIKNKKIRSLHNIVKLVLRDFSLPDSKGLQETNAVIYNKRSKDEKNRKI